MVVLATIFGLAICIAAYTGLTIGDRSVRAFEAGLAVPLTFVSSAFVPFDHARLRAPKPAGHHRHRHHALDGPGPIATNLWLSIAAERDLHRVPPLAVRLPPGG
jgi:hypothetical protein